MSRRNKPGIAPLVIHGVSNIEFRLKNYMHLNDIYRGNNGMQTIIINSFFNQRGGDNEMEWADKLAYCNEHFGKFAQYAQTWKQQTFGTNE